MKNGGDIVLSGHSFSENLMNSFDMKFLYWNSRIMLYIYMCVCVCMYVFVRECMCVFNFKVGGFRYSEMISSYHVRGATLYNQPAFFTGAQECSWSFAVSGTWVYNKWSVFIIIWLRLNFCVLLNAVRILCWGTTCATHSSIYKNNLFLSEVIPGLLSIICYSYRCTLSIYIARL